MRMYTGTESKCLQEIVCNKCGRSIKVENGIVKEGYFSANPSFGYFSRKDGTGHSFDVCEMCYDDWVSSFAIPVEKIEETELC